MDQWTSRFCSFCFIPSHNLQAFPVYRKQGWWAEQSRVMERMIQKQRQKLTAAVWDDDIMKTSEPMRRNNENVP